MNVASKVAFFLLAFVLLGFSAENGTDTSSVEVPEYTTDGQLKLPAHYREWVYLTSDYYSPFDPAKAQTGSQRKFNDIFVNPSAYRSFLQTGIWPDKAMFVVDQREADDMESNNPNQKGTAQGSQVGLAMHVKDKSRFPGKWAFFGFGSGGTAAKMIPASAGCYSCHATHGASDTTFVQFYPTLLPAAKSNNTLSPDYVREHESVMSPTK